MGLKLNPYPEYKDSGLPWLGEVPEHWEIRRNGGMFAQRVETGYPELPILEVSLNTGVRVRNMDDFTRKQVMSDYGQYKRAVEGDIAYNMMRMWQGAVGRAPTDGLISPAYVVARPHHGAESRYYGYLFRTDAYMDEVNKYSRGIVSDRNRLYWEEFKQMPSALPPPNEQRRIADFLDAHGRILQQWIQAKQRLIERLNEQKQSIIQQAVTRGLDPKISMKRTGLDWLPEVPEHWKVSKLKFAARLIVGGSTPPSQQLECWNGDVVWVTPEDVAQKETLSDSSRRITVQGVASCSTVLVPSGSIVITSRAPVGNLAIAALELCTNQGCKAIVPHLERLDSQYGYYLLHVLKLEIQSLAKGTTFPEISTFELSNIQIPLPRIEEQQEIRAFILEESWSINQAIERTHREIDLIREYRTRLVSDVVTGKLDVRDAELPDIEEENKNLLPIEPDDDRHGELLAAEGVDDVNL
ncbi:restriction endonuclease subunit S [Rubrobacter aplysinae]|uniref:restriction endonuclease subunit S n=1 Tax=Rubrobacter aplysinae TaxID=909625 RepID=UPI00064BCA24|nr:restriction endonuclease subunit S [Rubrobacter aplysinae]